SVSGDIRLKEVKIINQHAYSVCYTPYRSAPAACATTANYRCKGCGSLWVLKQSEGSICKDRKIWDMSRGSSYLSVINHRAENICGINFSVLTPPTLSVCAWDVTVKIVFPYCMSLP
uniref:BCL2 associated transcription factor 1 n=1 Tax=Xenopus tropicalis TaxID=8364 RepID=A0A803J4B9_XENTR